MEYGKNNISTIIVWLSAILTPIIIQYGININEATLTAILWGSYLLIATIYSSYHPNKLGILGNAPDKSVDPTEPVLNDEYEYGDDQ